MIYNFIPLIPNICSKCVPFSNGCRVINICTQSIAFTRSLFFAPLHQPINFWCPRNTPGGSKRKFSKWSFAKYSSGSVLYRGISIYLACNVVNSTGTKINLCWFDRSFSYKQINSTFWKPEYSVKQKYQNFWNTSTN